MKSFDRTTDQERAGKREAVARPKNWMFYFVVSPLKTWRFETYRV